MSAILPDLRELQRGDENAWTQAFETLWPFAYHAALTARAGTTPEEAEDLAIEAMQQLVRCAGSVTSAEGLKPLVITIARRRAVSLVRHETAAKRPQVAVHLDELPGHDADSLLSRESTRNPASDTEAAELLALLHGGLNELDATTNNLLLAQIVDGLTTRELGERFQLPPGTVSVKIMRGLQALRQRLRQNPRLLKELEEYLR